MSSGLMLPELPMLVTDYENHMSLYLCALAKACNSMFPWRATPNLPAELIAFITGALELGAGAAFAGGTATGNSDGE